MVHSMPHFVEPYRGGVIFGPPWICSSWYRIVQMNKCARKKNTLLYRQSEYTWVYSQYAMYAVFYTIHENVRGGSNFFWKGRQARLKCSWCCGFSPPPRTIFKLCASGAIRSHFRYASHKIPDVFGNFWNLEHLGLGPGSLGQVYPLGQDWVRAWKLWKRPPMLY